MGKLVPTGEGVALYSHVSHFYARVRFGVDSLRTGMRVKKKKRTLWMRAPSVGRQARGGVRLAVRRTARILGWS